MSIIGLIVTIAVLGFLLWVVVTYVPMVEPFKKILIAVCAVALVLWLAFQFGFLDALRTPIRFR